MEDGVRGRETECSRRGVRGFLVDFRRGGK
jgi:hypothetical protein